MKNIDDITEIEELIKYGDDLLHRAETNKLTKEEIEFFVNDPDEIYPAKGEEITPDIEVKKEIYSMKDFEIIEDVAIFCEDVVKWLKDYMIANQLLSCVVGVSGGVDSAVVERLCEKTGLKVICVAMPMYLHGDSDVNTLDLAMKLCAGRDVEFHIREIGPIIEIYKKASIGVIRLAEGNLRSRIRANILYDFAGNNFGFVVGTGNLDEDTIGYMTKGGDGLVDICPISMFHKSEVRKMARLLEVPEEIINAVPTAGLWDGQTDEQELGMTYDEVEWAIEYNGLDHCTNRQQQVMEKVNKMRVKNQHKLAYPPVYKTFNRQSGKQ